MDMPVQALYAPVMADKSALAVVLERWQSEQRLEWSELARMAGVSRGTLNNIRKGAGVNSDSLRKIAKGLATHPNTGAFDRLTHDRALRELFQARGFIVSPEYPRADLRTTVAEIVGPARADQVDGIVRELATLPPHLQDRWLDMARVAMIGLRAQPREI